MKLTMRDYVAAALVAAIAIPYVGYLVNAEMPFIKDARGMAATGLVLGVAAFLVFRRGDRSSRLSNLDKVLSGTSAVLGVVALVAAETAAHRSCSLCSWARCDRWEHGTFGPRARG